jgi:hypothetical protein
VSFGPKLHELPVECSAREQIVVTLAFTPQYEDFEREVEIYVEGSTGIQTIKLTVKSGPREPAS